MGVGKYVLCSLVGRYGCTWCGVRRARWGTSSITPLSDCGFSLKRRTSRSRRSNQGIQCQLAQTGTNPIVRAASSLQKTGPRGYPPPSPRRHEPRRVRRQADMLCSRCFLLALPAFAGAYSPNPEWVLPVSSLTPAALDSLSVAAPVRNNISANLTRSGYSSAAVHKAQAVVPAHGQLESYKIRCHEGGARCGGTDSLARSRPGRLVTRVFEPWAGSGRIPDQLDLLQRRL